MQTATERQLFSLIESATALLDQLEPQKVRESIIDLAQKFVPADAYAVWERVGNGWSLCASSGLSPEFVELGRVLLEGVLAVPEHCITVEDVATSPLLETRREALIQEGITSVMILPLNTKVQIGGTLVFYWKTRHTFPPAETQLAIALGKLAASAIATSHLYAAQLTFRGEAEVAEKRSAFLERAGRILGSSLDYEKTLASVAELAVPVFADWAAVDLLEEGGTLRRVAIHHSDPSKVPFAFEFAQRYPLREIDSAMLAMRTLRPVMMEELPDELITLGAINEEHARDIRQLGLVSFIIAPLVAEERALGTVTFATAESGRRFNAADLSTAEELTRRASTAIEHARLYKTLNEHNVRFRSLAKRLRHANRALRRANADLQQFAYSASHDLREPLRIVSMYSELLEQRLDGSQEECKFFLRTIREGTQRLEHLLRDLLTYTLVLLDRPSAAAVLVDPHRVLGVVFQNLSAIIRQTDATVEISPSLPALFVTEVHLLQLFQNLISNALKYRSEEPPRVVVSAEPLDGMWKFCIADNGIGIAPRYAAQIFGLFTRLHGSDRYEGTGLGLAICERIVRRYGGRIWVESQGEGHGSSFQFTLPGPA